MRTYMGKFSLVRKHTLVRKMVLMRKLRKPNRNRPSADVKKSPVGEGT